MSSLVLPSAAAAIAHKRLSEAVELLERKTQATTFNQLPDEAVVNVAIRDTERRVLALATRARDLFQGAGRVDIPADLHLVSGLSQFAVFGSAGFELPLYTEAFGRDLGRPAAVMRSGAADPYLSHVEVKSTEFARQFHALGLVNASSNRERDVIRAVAMGLHSGAANEIITGPVELGLADRTAAIARAERQLMDGALGGSGAFGRWQSWWPSANEVPDVVYDTYIEALEEVYGFTHDELTKDVLAEAYVLMRQDTLTATWSWGTWFGVLFPGLIAMPLGLLIGRFLPNGGRFFFAGSPGEQGAYEILTLGMGLGSLAPFGWSMYLWSQLRGMTEVFVNTLIMGIVRLGLSIAGLATSAANLAAPARWAGLWLPQQLIDIYALVRGIIDQVGDRTTQALVWFINTFPTINGLLTLLHAALFEALNLNDELAYWLILVAIFGAWVFGAGIPIALALEGSKLFVSRPDGLPVLDSLRSAEGGNPLGLARVFDESTLWRDPGATTDPPELAEFRYPAGERPLVKVWRDPEGLEISQSGHRIELRLGGGGAATPVSLGLADLTPAGIVARLTGAGITGLEAEAVESDLPEHELPWPTTLASTDGFVAVGTSADDAHVINQAPRLDLTSKFGVEGPSASALDGFSLVPTATLADLDTSSVGLAGDLAALLAMGAAPSTGDDRVAATNISAGPADLGAVTQVFRKWNLDERRVNEWQTLVAGGAQTETAAAPGTGERVANAMGWLPAWRAWLRVAADLTADTADNQPQPYTPVVDMGGGERRAPSNAELTDAIRHLFSLPA